MEFSIVRIKKIFWILPILFIVNLLLIRNGSYNSAVSTSYSQTGTTSGRELRNPKQTTRQISEHKENPINSNVALSHTDPKKVGTGSSSRKASAHTKEIPWNETIVQTTLSEFENSSSTVDSAAGYNLITPGNFEITSQSIKLPDNSSHFFRILNPDLCSRTEPVVLIWVFSSPGNFKARQAIRLTWGRSKDFDLFKVTVVFSLALTSDLTVQRQIDEEFNSYGDIIQDGTFGDSFGNSTQKVKGMLKWTSMMCPQMNLLMKTGDDSFIFPNRFTKWLNESFIYNNTWPTNSVICNVASNQKVQRRGRYAVSVREHPRGFFAPQTCPTTYILTKDSLPNLVNAIRKVPFLWLEDMYVSSNLAPSIGMTYINVGEHHYRSYQNSGNRVFRVFFQNTKIHYVGHLPYVERTYQMWDFYDLMYNTKLVDNLYE